MAKLNEFLLNLKDNITMVSFDNNMIQWFLTACNLFAALTDMWIYTLKFLIIIRYFFRSNLKNLQLTN